MRQATMKSVKQICMITFVIVVIFITYIIYTLMNTRDSAEVSASITEQKDKVIGGLHKEIKQYESKKRIHSTTASSIKEGKLAFVNENKNDQIIHQGDVVSKETNQHDKENDKNDVVQLEKKYQNVLGNDIDAKLKKKLNDFKREDLVPDSNTITSSKQSLKQSNNVFVQKEDNTKWPDKKENHKNPEKINTDPIKTRIHEITPRGKNLHWVDDANGVNFTVRISQYNDAITKIKDKILEARGSSDWQPIIDPSPHVLWCNGDDFMFKLQNYDQVQTVVLPWFVPKDGGKLSSLFSLKIKKTGDDPSAISWSSLTDKHNVLVQKYYEWAATEPLCKHIKTPGFTKARWDAVFNRECNTDINKTLTPQSLEILYFYGKPINKRDYWPNDGLFYPSYFYNELPDRVLYMHIIQDAVVTVFGDVHSGNLKLVPYSCSQDTNPQAPDYSKAPIFNEVISINQYWGDAFFHKMLEGVPRLAPYIEFLQENKNIKIHVSESRGYTRGLLKFLGFGPERIISGVIRAKVLYLPQATPCGFARVQEIQLISKLYRDRIQNFGLGARNLIILIQRSGSRHFHKKGEMAAVVEKVAADFGLEYLLFPDNPTPSMEESMHAFNQAVMVVAPHGAGLANMVYSEPGTFIIEGVCNPPHINMCFQWTAHVLGHHFHGIPSQSGCEDKVVVEPDLVDVVMRIYLSKVKEKGFENVFGVPFPKP